MFVLISIATKDNVNEGKSWLKRSSSTMITRNCLSYWAVRPSGTWNMDEDERRSISSRHFIAWWLRRKMIAVWTRVINLVEKLVVIR